MEINELKELLSKSWIKKGHYVKYRVFFKDEDTAIEAGYRPCAICMPDEYKEWKNNKDSMKLVHKKSYFE